MTGFKNPPKEHQFVPGQSGNPKGRHKGSKNISTILEQLLSQKVVITQNGEQMKIDKKTAMFMQNINKAIKGDIKAFQALLPYIAAIDEKNAQHEAIKEQMSINSQEILANLKQRWLREQNTEVQNV